MYKCTLFFVLFLSAILLSIFIRFKLLISPVFLSTFLLYCLFVCLFVCFVFCFSLFLIIFFVFVFVFVVLFLGGGIILLLFLYPDSILLGNVLCVSSMSISFQRFYYGFYSSRKIEAHYFICFPQFLNYIDILWIDKLYHKWKSLFLKKKKKKVYYYKT